MDTLTLSRCTVADLQGAPNIGTLIEEYAAESCRVGLRPDPQWGTYQAVEAQGLLHVVAAWLGDELIGFLFLFVCPQLHYGATLAVAESLFITHGRRGTGAGRRMLREAEALAREQGAAGLLVSAPTDSRLAQVLSGMRRFRESNRVFFQGLA